MAELMAQPALRDVALVLALLAVMATVAFVARAQPPRVAQKSREDENAP